MKKFSFIFTILLAAATFSAGAQGIEDALRYSQQFYVGSARTMAMGNAFTALGGDLGALGINPASSALYNCCEFAVTGGLSWNNTTAQFEGSEGINSTKADRTRFTIPNIAAIFSVPTGREYGLVNYTFGFGLTKTNNFNGRVSFGGYDARTSLLGNLAAGLAADAVPQSELLDPDAFINGYCTPQEIMAFDTYLVNPYHDIDGDYIGATENEWDGGLGVENPLWQSYDRVTGGGIYDMQFNFGMNFTDRLYLGVNANIKMVDYDENLWYGEDGNKDDWFDSGFKSMKYNYWQRTSGVGANLQLGAIWVPIDFLRVGVSYTTPTVFNLTDTWGEYMQGNFDGSATEKTFYESETDPFSFDYRVKAPARLSLGAAVVFGREGLLSVDVERANYSKMVMSDSNHNTATFEDINKDIRDYCYSGTIIRLGGELNVLNDVSLRAGYNCYLFNQPAYQYVSFGIGKRISENSSLDLAFRTSFKDRYEMKPYDDYAFDADGNPYCIAPVATISSGLSDLMLTWRVKF